MKNSYKLIKLFKANVNYEMLTTGSQAEAG